MSPSNKQSLTRTINYQKEAVRQTGTEAGREAGREAGTEEGGGSEGARKASKTLIKNDTSGGPGSAMLIGIIVDTPRGHRSIEA